MIKNLCLSTENHIKSLKLRSNELWKIKKERMNEKDKIVLKFG